MNKQLGYASPSDLTDHYPQFYWNSVSAHIQGAIRHLNVTSSWRQQSPIYAISSAPSVNLACVVDNAETGVHGGHITRNSPHEFAEHDRWREERGAAGRPSHGVWRAYRSTRFALKLMLAVVGPLGAWLCLRGPSTRPCAYHRSGEIACSGTRWSFGSVALWMPTRMAPDGAATPGSSRPRPWHESRRKFA